MSRIIFGSANHWTSPYQVGSHAWARLFASHGWQTLYVSDPLTPWHWLDRDNRQRTRERFALWRGRDGLFEAENVKAWTPFSLIAPHRLLLFQSKWVLRHWDCFAVPNPQGYARRRGFAAPDVLWLDSIRHASWGRALRPRFVVLRVADWIAGFSAATRSALELERELLVEADLVITSARTLEDRVRSIRGNQPLCTIRNGVDVSFWGRDCAPPSEYARIPPPRAVYVGALDEWFDTTLLFQAARALPRVSFVLIGQRRCGGAREESPPNLHWLGTRTRTETRACLRHAHVGIIPFKRNDLIDCVCPLKLYEYMACGLPVVSTRWDEIERMNSPARLAVETEEWIMHLRNLLNDIAHPTPSASSIPGATGQWADASLAYALANDWGQRWLQWQSAYENKDNHPCHS
ncbi:MAG: glycosyltransferase [Verrucomicrobia bacterium]|nr:glycosyltransferase [Verrucomicrobiota bacterium]